MIDVLPLILACVTFVTIGQTCFRIGARGGEAAGDDGFLSVIGRPIVWLGVLAFIAHFCVWMLVLNRIDLGVAYPLMSIDYIAVTLVSSLFLGETVRRRRWIGVGCIVLGVVLIGGG